MHNATVITTGSANQWPNTPCIRLWIDVTFRGLEHSYKITLSKWLQMDVLCQHNAHLFNAWMFFIFFMEDNVIFKGKFSLSLHLFFLNLNQPPDLQNYVPTNVPIFMNPRKLGPSKMNDFTVSFVIFLFFNIYLYMCQMP